MSGNEAQANRLTELAQANRIQSWITASFSCETQEITAPVVEIPQLLKIAALTFKQRAAAHELKRLQLRHTDFAARHDNDDPAHEDYLESSRRLRYAIAGYDKALHALLENLNQSIELDRVQVSA